MKVTGKLVMVDNSVAKNNLKVLGAFKLPNTPIASNISNKEILFINANGKIMKGGFQKMLAELHKEKGCSQTYLDNPYWMNDTNQLFTPCPEMQVGIRTNNPLYALDVRGEGYFSAGIKVGDILSLTTPPAFIEGYAGLTNNRPWIRMSSSLTGTDKTLFLVENDGNMFCTAVRVRISDDIAVPDYVFKSDYQLMPLAEVKSYVEENRHLPNIPSEQEIKEDGLSIEQMQLKLLEKVEELTLYVIQLEEQRKEQDQKIENLQKQINQNN